MWSWREKQQTENGSTGLYALLLLGAVLGAYRVQWARLLRKSEMKQARLRAEAAELQARAMQTETQALEAKNERSRIELEKAHELETAYHQLEETHEHLKTTQAQLVQSEKMASLGQLTAGIAHELKNPLNFVNNFAELNEELARDLIEELTGDEDHETLEDLAHSLKTNAVQIAKHGRRADRIVEGMMDHARGGTGERYEVGVNAFVNEYVGLSFQAVQVQKPDLQVKIERGYDEAVGTVTMAPQELGRALLNVLNNAFEAVYGRMDAETGRRGDAEKGYEPAVAVSTRRGGDTVEIRVADNGPGIPAEVQEKIFEPFFTTKPTGQGSTGLGLSLSYDIVTQGHGGTLTVESTGGQGTMFVITLPL